MSTRVCKEGRPRESTINNSQLALDRKRESRWILGLILLLAAGSLLVPNIDCACATRWVDQGAAFAAVALSCWVLLWCIARCWRMLSRRGIWFNIGLMVWTIVQAGILFVPLFQSNLLIEGFELLPIVLVLPIIMLVISALSIGFGTKAANASGWCVAKPLHCCLLLAIVLLSWLVMPLDSIVWLWVAVIQYILTRYCFNRWIFARYQLKNTDAAALFIQGLRNSRQR